MRNRFPFCRQLDSRQCGIASVAMISRFYGKKYSLRFLEGMCDLSREGVSLKALHDLVQNLGFSSQAGRLTLSQLRECQLPAILHWNQNHFVVLYKIKGDCFHIADPGKGLRRVKISMVSGFFNNLLKLPMSFFDTRLLGDLIERMADHTRKDRMGGGTEKAV